MIGELANDLFEKLNAIPALSGKVGLAVGGHKADPGLSSAPLPLAWVLFHELDPTDELRGGQATRQSMRCFFRVFVIAEYASQEGLVSTLYPLLESCMKSIRGTEAPSGTNWHLEKMGLTQMNPDRLYHELRFSTNVHF